MDGIERSLKIFCDNKSALLYSNNNRSSTKSKHIDIKFLIVKERVQSGQVSIEHIRTNCMVADPLTKDYHQRFFMSTPLIWVFYLFRIYCFNGSLYFECLCKIHFMVPLWLIYGYIFCRNKVYGYLFSL